MVDNKKIKLPQHLQLDSVSPATRLLEKRRAMYEVQKAFEDQKEEFQKKEERFKLRETELREKDILIQDHLIKFSTYLQQHEIRRKKDLELADNEKIKIDQKVKEIQDRENAQKSLDVFESVQPYQEKHDKIYNKVNAMRKFEQFLETVKSCNEDEFAELKDILSRYDTLKQSNEKLQTSQKQLTEELDKINNEISNYTREQNANKMKLNNKIAKKQKTLEQIEERKNQLLAESEENTSKKMKKTTEHGQILMTISNLFDKCKKRDMFIKNLKQEDPKNFNNMQLSGESALEKLEIIKNCLVNFQKLKKQLDQVPHIQQQKKIMRENNEIV